MKLLLDEMLPAAVAQQLRRRGTDALAITERPDLRGVSDRDLFDLTQEEGRAVVTYNRDDFLAIDGAYRQERREHAGIVILNPRRFPQGRSGAVGSLVTSLSELAEGGAPYQSFIHWLQ